MKLVLCVALLASPLFVEAKPPPQPFAYKYGVKDGYSGDDFAKSENQDAFPMATFHVNHPDGRIKTVTYNPDHYNGYVAEVQYEGYPMPMYRSAAAARNMPGELFSSDVGALDFSGPALDSGAVIQDDFNPYEQAPAPMYENDAHEYYSPQAPMYEYPSPPMRQFEIDAPAPIIGGHQMVTPNHQQAVPEGRWDHHFMPQAPVQMVGYPQLPMAGHGYPQPSTGGHNYPQPPTGGHGHGHGPPVPSW